MRGVLALFALFGFFATGELVAAVCPTEKCMANACVDNSDDYKCSACKQGWVLTEAQKCSSACPPGWVRDGLELADGRVCKKCSVYDGTANECSPSCATAGFCKSPCGEIEVRKDE